MAAVDVVVLVAFAPIAVYPGGLFLLNAVAALALSAAVVGGSPLAWHLGALLAGATVVLFVAVRTVGLPGFRLYDWLVLVGPLPLGPLSLVVEGAFLVLWLTSWVTRRRGRGGR